MNRARSSAELPGFGLTGSDNTLKVRFPKHWFSANPLTHADLVQEQAFLAARGFDLKLATRKD